MQPWSQFNNNPWNQGSAVHVPRVHGEAGAKQYALPANSDMLFLDDSNPIVYLKTTDAAGYGTISKWRVEEIKDPEPADMNAISTRIDSLESKMEEMLRRLDNGKSNYSKTRSEQTVTNNAAKHQSANEAQ